MRSTTHTPNSNLAYTCTARHTEYFTIESNMHSAKPRSTRDRENTERGVGPADRTHLTGVPGGRQVAPAKVQDPESPGPRCREVAKSPRPIARTPRGQTRLIYGVEIVLR